MRLIDPSVLLLTRARWVLVALCCAIAACGGPSAQATGATLDQVLDVITAVAKPRQEAFVQRCMAAELRAADLPDLAAAEAEVARVRGACDVVLGKLLALRRSQLAARTAADRVRAGEITVQEAVELAMQVRDAYAAAVAAIANAPIPVEAAPGKGPVAAAEDGGTQ